MRIGIGVPATVPGASGAAILEWARRAERGPFSSLGIIDRVVYGNYEPLVTLAVAAGATQRIRLMTTVLLAPTRDTALLAKQAASLDALSGGRLTLGLGVGGRQDDFGATGASFHTRGQRFEQQLATLKRVWSGEPFSEDIGPIGPPPGRAGGPELLVGGYTPKAVGRVARWADGFISGGTDAGTTRTLYHLADEAWKAEGRPGSPRFVAAAYWALGPHAREGVASAIGSYYTFMGPRVENMISSIAATPEAVKSTIQSFADVGVDELILWPCIAEPDQVDRLTELVR